MGTPWPARNTLIVSSVKLFIVPVFDKVCKQMACALWWKFRKKKRELIRAEGCWFKNNTCLKRGRISTRVDGNGLCLGWLRNAYEVLITHDMSTIRHRSLLFLHFFPLLFLHFNESSCSPVIEPSLSVCKLKFEAFIKRLVYARNGKESNYRSGAQANADFLKCLSTNSSSWLSAIGNSLFSVPNLHWPPFFSSKIFWAQNSSQQSRCHVRK